jgi:hypothetical protein
VETIVALNIDVVRRGIIIGSALPIATTGVVDIPQIVFTNPITNTHVNRTIDRSLMSSMVIGRYRSANVVHPKKVSDNQIIITTPIIDHIDGHYVKPNMVAFKYLDFKKHVDLNAHVRVFNSIVKANVETFEEYIINVFSYTLRDITSNWCHNYMSEFLNYIFLELKHAFCKHHQKT